MLRGVGGCKQYNFIEHKTEICIFQAQFARAGEVHENLHHAVETMDFAVDDVHVAAGVRIDLLQFVPQQLQMEHDGVDRVLDLVSNPACDASAGRNPPRKFNFIFNTTGRLGIAHGQQGANLRPFFLDEIQGQLHATAIRGLNLPLLDGVVQPKSIQQQRAKWRFGGKDLSGALSMKLPARPTEKTLHRRAYQHNFGIAREEHEAVLQARHDLVDIALQRGEDFAGVPHLAANGGQFLSDPTVFITNDFVFPAIYAVCLSDTVETATDVFQRA